MTCLLCCAVLCCAGKADGDSYGAKLSIDLVCVAAHPMTWISRDCLTVHTESHHSQRAQSTTGT